MARDDFKDGVAQEDEYFFKLDQELLEKKRKALDEDRADHMAKDEKEDHWMKCPKCGAKLEEINMENVMIDKCTGCEGIWLDHGELELLAEGQTKLSKGFLDKLFG